MEGNKTDRPCIRLPGHQLSVNEFCPHSRRAGTPCFAGGVFYFARCFYGDSIIKEQFATILP